MKILVVEDNKQDFLLMKKSISSDFDLQHVLSLKEAIESLKLKKYDVIILDLNLPDSQGSETFDKINCHSPEIPIIVTTTIDCADITEKVAENGCFLLFKKNELPTPLFERALIFAHLYYGSEHERAARGTSLAVRNLQKFLNKSSFKKKD